MSTSYRCMTPICWPCCAPCGCTNANNVEGSEGVTLDALQQIYLPRMAVFNLLVMALFVTVCETTGNNKVITVRITFKVFVFTHWLSANFSPLYRIVTNSDVIYKLIKVDYFLQDALIKFYKIKAALQFYMVLKNGWWRK